MSTLVRSCLAALIALASIPAAAAEDPAGQMTPVFNPDFVLSKAAAIGLSEQQAAAVTTALQQFQREMQERQMALLTSIRDLLTPEQQNSLRALEGDMPAFMQEQQKKQEQQQQIAHAVGEKAQQAMQLIQALQAKGGDVTSAAGKMGEVQQLMSQGKFAEAIAVLDALIATLSG